MKNLKILLALLFFATLTIVACNKENSITQQNQAVSEIGRNDEDEIEYDDSDPETEIEELEQRASTSIKITSLSYPLTQPAGQCGNSKYDGYALYFNNYVERIESESPGSTAQAAPYRQFKDITIRGYGFGATQGTITGLVKTQAISFSITSWSDSLILAKPTTYVSDDLKNFLLKISVTNTTTNKIAKKSLKCLATYFENGTPTALTQPNTYFGQKGWDVVYHTTRNGWYGKGGTVKVIDTTYVPMAGDMLHRKFNGQLDDARGIAIVTKVTTSAKGIVKVYLKERNLDCNGKIRSKSYVYDKGVFTRVGEDQTNREFFQRRRRNP